MRLGEKTLMMGKLEKGKREKTGGGNIYIERQKFSKNRREESTCEGLERGKEGKTKREQD